MDLLPTKARNAINIVIDLINTVVMALFFYGSITVIQNALNSGQRWNRLRCSVIRNSQREAGSGLCPTSMREPDAPSEPR